MASGATLIVVADSGRARFLSRGTPGGEVTELVDLHMSAGADAFEPDNADQAFLREVAASIDGTMRSYGFANLVICAPPPAIGGIRSGMSDRARQMLRFCFGKDLCDESPGEIEARLVEFHV